MSVGAAGGGALGPATGLLVVGRAMPASRPLRDPAVSARLQAALEARVAAGAPGALARIEAPRVGLSWGGSAGYLARGKSRALRPDDAFRAASVTKSVTAAVAVRPRPPGAPGARRATGWPAGPRTASPLARPGCSSAHHAAPAARAHLGPAQLLHGRGVRRAAASGAGPRLAPGRAGGPCGRVRNAALPSRPGLRVLRHRLRGRRDPGGAGDRPAAARGLPRARLRPARDGHDLAGRSRACADPGRGTPLLGRARLDDDLPDDRLGRRRPRHHRARPGPLRACAVVRNGSSARARWAS